MTARRSRLGELDLVDRLPRFIPPIIIQIGFGFICVLAAVGARMFVNLFAASAGPYSLIYPAILISTLFGRWQSGLVTFVGAFAYAWYAVLPYHYSFEFADPADGARTIVNGAAALVIVVFAELFRAAVRRAVLERNAQIRTHELLLRELDHRTKNNFAMVASLLEMQRRHHPSEDVQEALAVAGSRVHSFAAIHNAIYSGGDYVEEINMRDYLSALIRQLSGALFLSDTVSITLDCDPADLPRDTAVAIGLVTNEVVTNAAKHAFAEGDTGIIHVTFRSSEHQPWCLTITDDGRGTPGNAKPASRSSGLGARLIDAFARKAGGELRTEWPGKGTRVSLTQSAEAFDDT